MDAYLICATPRTGSSLLCGLLASTGIAGRPESYFREQDEPSWASQWGLACSDGTFDYADYIRGVLAAGRTENGVFAARLMWGTLDEVIAKLGTLYRDLAGRDIDLLNRAFGQTRFVYLQRDDVVAQAVSWLRAEQTQVWVDQRDKPQGEPHFEFGELRELCRTIDDQNAAWRSWFATGDVEPYPIRYEDLDRHPVNVTRGLLDFLGLEVPSDRNMQVRHRRMADQLNAQWIERYRAAIRP